MTTKKQPIQYMYDHEEIHTKVYKRLTPLEKEIVEDSWRQVKWNQRR